MPPDEGTAPISHPWGESHGESHEVADIVARLDRAIETVSEEKVIAAIAGVEKAIAERNALPKKILKGVLGAVAGLIKL